MVGGDEAEEAKAAVVAAAEAIPEEEIW